MQRTIAGGRRQWRHCPAGTVPHGVVTVVLNATAVLAVLVASTWNTPEYPGAAQRPPA